MLINKPDPQFISSKRAQRNFSLALKIALWAVLLLWLILIADSMLGLHLARFGLRPRHIPGLVGIFTAPLLHGGFEHLFSNTLPLLISLTAILYLYPASAMRVIPVIWIGSGLLAWFIGRPSLHFGASGFVYGLLAYVFIGGLLRLDMRSVAVSVMVWFLYGSMIWGVLPIRPNMSWELHLSGAILGVALAIAYRRWDIAPVKRYAWEDDDGVPEWFPQRELPSEDTAREVSAEEASLLDLETGNDENESGGDRNLP
ncbi:MAG: rhomboid family intramembrane serine protease [Xanthomonadales bacterium]|nr:rhomboid family intramembrane serine protease [Xanthomonadales bacterium]